MGQSQGGQHPDLSAFAVAGPSLHGRPEEQGRPVHGAALRQRGEVRDGLSLLLQAEEKYGRRPLVRLRRTQSDARMRGDQHPSQTNGHGRGFCSRSALAVPALDEYLSFLVLYVCCTYEYLFI